LNEVVALQQEFTKVLGTSGGFGFGRGQPDPSLSEEERALQQHRRQLMGVYNSLNASGVRQGSLYPPTETHRGIVESARAALNSLVR
jgi:hypothetical protein